MYLLLALCAGSNALRAQESSAQVQASPAVSTPDGEEAARLLVLTNGSVLRVRARHTEAGWEILTGKSDWKALGEGVVVRATLERDALADARRLEQQLTSGPRQEQNMRRVGLAEWLAKQGLTTEALSQLDRVLSADPDQRQALRLMASLAPQVGVDAIDAAMTGEEPVLGVLRAAANGTPSVREIAIQRLAFGGPTDELRNSLRAQLGSHSPRIRALSTLALRRIYPGKNLHIEEVKELINRSVLDGSDEVRAEAARALRDVQDPDVTGPALHALNSANPRVRENSISALGAMGYPAAVPPLMSYLSWVNSAAAQQTKSSGVGGGSIFIGTQTAYVQDFDVQVAQFSSIADPQVNVLVEGSVLDARVLGAYTVSYATEARLTRSSLANLTGVDFGSSNHDWMAWWDSNKSKWNTPPVKPGETGSTASTR
jgi:hypothetical protein